MIDYSFYLCTDSDMNTEYKIDECVKQAILGGVTFVQVREKNKSYAEFLRIALSIKKITDMYNIPLVINDNINIAIEIDASGVHLGQNDLSCAEARKLLGNDKIIGVSVTTLNEAKKAVADGANYLGVGAIYKSQTKKDAKVVENKEFQKILDFSPIPIVVIGGINKNTIPNFNNMNVSGYAMIRPILGQDDIVMSSKRLKKIITDNMKS